MADANTPQKSGSTASSTPIQMDTVKPLQSQAVKIPSSPSQTVAQDADTLPDGEVAYSTTDVMADDAAGELGTEPTGLFGGISALAGGGGGMAAGAGAAGLALAGLGGAAGGGGSAASTDSTNNPPTASSSVQQNTSAGTATDATSGRQTGTAGSETTQTETGKKPGETGTTTDNSGQGEASTSGPFTAGATTVTEKAPAESVPVAGAEAEKNIVSGGQAFDKGAADNGVAAPGAPSGDSSGGGGGDADTSMPTLDASTLTAGAGLPSAPDDSGGSGGSSSDLFTVDPEGGQLSLPGGVSASESGDTFDVGVPTRSISSTAGDSEATVIPMNPGQV